MINFLLTRYQFSSFFSLPENMMLDFAYPLGAVFVYLGVLVVIADVLSRLLPKDPELTRKIVHIGSGNVILLAWWFNISRQVIVSAAIIAAAIAITSYIIPILPSIESVGRKSFGTLFYAISIGVLSACFWQTSPQYTVIGILIMAWGDGMAAIIGQRFGRHTYKIGEITKSWEGSLAMATASFAVSELVLLSVEGNSWHILLISIIVALIATILEAFSKLGIDNLSVPLGSGFICFLCLQAL